MKQGKVYLVGAGPGDPGLITCKAIECLAKADVVVYDRLIGIDIPPLVPEQAEKIYAGKSSGEHTLPQGRINHLLVEKAKEGKIVVRLKGGDPFVFGRGGEEAEELAANGIPFEVVPGISSSVAVPAYAGIPVTHRGVASSFAVITGHEDPAKDASSIKWDRLATAVDTLVFLMGTKNLAAIVEKLTGNGRPASTPVAVIKDGTTPRQRTVTGTLADIVDRVAEARLEPPAVIVVGDVVGLKDKISWFEGRPLSGKRILVTRSRRQASSLVKMLAEKGAQPVELPVIDIQPPPPASLDAAIAKMSSYDWIVFTSANGVENFFARLDAKGLDARAFKNSKIAAIGPATGEALECRGIVPDLVPEVFTTENLLETFGKVNVRGKRILLARADIVDKVLSDGLGRLGAEVDDIVAYVTAKVQENPTLAREILDAGVDVITFTSSSTVSNLLAALDGRGVPESCKIACIGPKTAATAREAGLRIDILAGEQTIPGLVAAIEDYFTKEG